MIHQNIPDGFDRIMTITEREQEAKNQFNERMIVIKEKESDSNRFWTPVSLIFCFIIVSAYLAILFYFYCVN